MYRLSALLCLLTLSSPAALAQNATPPVSQVLTGSGTGLPSTRLFGQSTASQGGFLAIGAPGIAATGVPGSVWVYTRTEDGLELFDVLQAPSPAAGDGFGQHLEFVGNQLLVGAPRRTAGGLSARGEVFVYLLGDGEFTLAQTLQPGVALNQGDLFGFHLSANNGWLAVGVPLAGANDEGQAQLYRYDGALEAWVFHSALPGPVQNGRRGLRVLVRGESVFLASPEEFTANGDTKGFVYEFQRSGNGASATFTLAQRFRPSAFPYQNSPQSFGSSLALSPDGGTLLVGAPFEEEVFGDRRGALYVFERNAGAWEQSQRLLSPAAGLGENFGASALFDSDGRAFAGDIRESDAGGTQAGAVYELRRSTLAPFDWQFGARYHPVNGAGGEFFGNALALSQGNVVITAPGVDVTGVGIDAGRAYVYSFLFGDGFE